MLNWVKDHYGGLDLFITEVLFSEFPFDHHSQNGVSDRQGNLDDLNRIYYYKHYINQAT